MSCRLSGSIRVPHGDGGAKCRGIGEGYQEGAEKVGQVGSLRWLKRSKARRLGIEERGQGIFGQFLSQGRQAHQDAAAVARVREPFDKPGTLQTVETDGHSPGGEEQGLGEL